MGHGETFLGMPIALARAPSEIWSDHVIVAIDEIVITNDTFRFRTRQSFKYIKYIDEILIACRIISTFNNANV